EVLGEHLAGFDLRRFPRRTEDAQAGFLENIHDPESERLFRAYNRQTDGFLLGKSQQPVKVRGFNGDVDAIHCSAGIARSTVDALDARRLSQFPHQGVLTPSFADNEYFHTPRSCAGNEVILSAVVRSQGSGVRNGQESEMI